MAPHFSAALAATPPGPGIEISLRIGQRVRHHDYRGQRTTGVVHGLSIDSDRVLQADIMLDAPIVIPARSDDDHEIRVWRQSLPAHELTALDDRDELIVELRLACEGLLAGAESGVTSLGAIRAARAAIANAPGSAA